MSKFKKLLIGLSTGILSLVPTTLALVSCGQTKKYNITFNTPVHLKWTKTATTVQSGSNLEMTYTLDDSYEIDEDNSTITSNGTNIKNQCNYATGTISIPSNVITGDIVITLKTKAYVTYDVSFNNQVEHLTWTSTVDNVKSGRTITMTYTLESGYCIDATKTTIKCGDTSIKDSIDYRYGTISIPSSLITDNIVIDMCVKQAATYTVSTSGCSDKISFTETTYTATEDATFVAGYTLESGWYIDTTTSKVYCGSDANAKDDITSHVSFGNGTIIISGQYVTGPLSFALTVTDTPPTGKYKEISGGEVVTTDSETGSGNKIHTLTLNDNSTTMSVTLYGVWENSSLVINKAGTYNITLENCTFSNASSSKKKAEAPVNVKKADGAIVNFILPTNSESSINDLRPYGTTTANTYSDDFVIRHNSTNGTGSLNFKGAGILNINNINNNKGAYTKAIQTKTDVTVSEGCTINAFSYDTCIQVGGKLTVDNANILADSYYDDGIKTKAFDPDLDLSLTNKNTNKDIIVKGKSVINVYSARNGIASAHDFITQSDTNGSPTINICTNTQASSAKSGSVGTVTLDEQNMYIQVPSSIVKNYAITNYYYTVDFYADKTSGTITSTEYMTLKKITDSNGYFFKCDRPLSTDGSYFKVNIYAKNQYGATSPSATATSGYIQTVLTPTLTSNNDCIAISSISGSTISTGTASSLNKNYKNLVKGDETSIDETIGSKGIKVNNDITINAGTISISSVDTCISASYGDIFCNSSTAGDITFGTGNITLNGGSLTGYSSESDGVKAYGEMNVKGGEINITKSKEALEAPVLNISGGITKLCADDDGLNASTGGTHTTSQINISISGGVLDVQTTNDITNDTDAIDSNNTVTITGGLLIARVPGSGSAMSLDWGDNVSNVTVTGTSTVVLLGNTEADGMHEPNPGPQPGSNKSITNDGTDYTSSCKSKASTQGDHIITYYITSGNKSTYTYNNKKAMNSTTVRIWSCTGQVTIN